MEITLLHSVNQDSAQVEMLENLDESSVLLVQDWAMKYLPRKYRESQTNWFGKRGIPQHDISKLGEQTKQKADPESVAQVMVRQRMQVVTACLQAWIFSLQAKLLASFLVCQQRKPFTRR